LAERHLNRAQSFITDEGYDDSVGKAQLSVENSVKAIISCFRIPSWSHDPSGELEEVISANRNAIVKLFGEGYLDTIMEACQAAAKLAPEHGKTTYGDVISYKPPWEIYDRNNAEEAVASAGKAFKVAKSFVERWFKPSVCSEASSHKRYRFKD